MGILQALRTSSSRREIRSENSVGCLSGIFHFLSRQHNRSLKRLTSAKKTENPTVTTTLLPPPTSTDTGRRACETPRSPTMPLEIRRPPPAAVAEIPDSPRRRSTVVARLMGLEEDTPAPSTAATRPPQPPPEEEEEDKRQELLRALEKCDEDLRALRRIIEAVRAKEGASPVGTAARRVEPDGGISRKERCDGGDQPSPVSVLEAISSPRSWDSLSPNGGDDNNKVTLSDDAQSCSFNRRKVFDETPKRSVIVERTQPSKGVGRWRMWPRRSRATTKCSSVGERWEDKVGEVENLGVLVELDILWEMVEELVVDMRELCWNLPPRSFESGCRCRKRLCL